MVTFKKLLQVDQFSALTLLNKHADLDRVIEIVDITETPDIKDYTSKNAFLMTTAIYFKDDQSGLKKLIDELVNVPVAGLGIKTSRFLKTIDPEILEHADKYNFPIFEIPEEWKLGQAVYQISSYISSEESQKLYFALEVQQRMNNMLIKDFTVERMVKNLANFLNIPMVLIDPFKEVEVESQHFNNNHRMLKEHLDYFNDVYLPEKNKECVSLNNNYAVFEVPALTYFPYYLIASDVEKVNYPFSLLAIEQAINTLSFAIYKNSKIRTTEQEDRDQFFKSLVQDKQPISLQSHPEYFDHYNLIDSNYYKVVVCGIDKSSTIENSEYVSERYFLTKQWLEKFLKNLDENINVFGFGDHPLFAILIQEKHEHYITFLKQLQNEYYNFFNETLSFGIGNEVTDLSQIHSSFYEALETFNSYKTDNKKAFIERYRTRNLEEILMLVPFDKLRPYVLHTLGELAFPTNTRDKELKKTLKIYMENQFDITKTSNLIFVHRNTVKYRINQVEDILNTKIDDPQKSLDIRLALFISEKILTDGN